MLSKAFLYSGTETPAPIELRAGPLAMRFEPQAAFLRQLRLGDHEVVRAVYAAVRDHDWATVSPEITITEQQIKPDSFRIVFQAVCRREPVDFSWEGTLIGQANGQVQFIFDGTAHSDFLRNRVGLCILHPITECSARPVKVEHVDGRVTEGRFPTTISPHQPFLDIKALSYEVATTGISARLEMDGDTFEMEDQRNWSDASFKTYCTPQALPMPHPVKSGDRVRQSLTLSLTGNVRPILPVNVGRPPQLSISTTPVVALPPIGLCVASHGQPLSQQETNRLKQLKLAHLRVDLRLADSSTYPGQLEQAANEAKAIGAGLHVALLLGEGDESSHLAAFTKHLERLKPPVRLWIILHESENPTREETVQRVRASLQPFDPNLLFAAGTRDFFTEINRARPEPGAASSVCYSTNPQVHAFDNITMIENLAGQAYNVETARQFTARPVVVSPVTLRIRNNTAAALEVQSKPAELPGDVDPRQLSLFGAGWTLGSIAKLVTTGFVHSLTYFETTGWRGVMESQSGSPLPSAFPSEPGMVFPIYHVFADIAEFGAKQIYPTHSSHPLSAEGLTLVNSSGGRRILVANLTDQLQNLKVKTGTCNARVRYLDETNAEEAMCSAEKFRQQAGETHSSVSAKIELKLLPYAIARVDVVSAT